MNASLIEIRADGAIVCLHCKEASDLLRKLTSMCTYTPCQFRCQFLFCVIDEPPNVDFKKKSSSVFIFKKIENKSHNSHVCCWHGGYPPHTCVCHNNTTFVETKV